MVVYQTEKSCIIYIEPKNYAYLAFEGFNDVDKVVEFTEKLTEICRQKNIRRLLIDSSKLSIFKLDAINHINKKVLPELRNLDIKKTAFVQSENLFGRISIQKIIQNITQSEVSVFHKFEEAENWLFQETEIYKR